MQSEPIRQIRLADVDAYIVHIVKIAASEITKNGNKFQCSNSRRTREMPRGDYQKSKMFRENSDKVVTARSE